MPLPKPGKDESKDKFLARCMANPVMNQEYEDNKQRFAVCNSLWRKKTMKMEKALMKCLIEKNKDNSYTFSISDETIDRDGEVIKVDGWKLGNYKKNPVILWAHKHDIPAIGVAERVHIQDGKLISKMRFAKEGSYQLADTIRALVDDGIINATSVGYIPMARDYPTDDKGKARKPRVITTKQELYEWSLVNVGSNTNALREAMVSNGYDEKAIDLVAPINWSKQLADTIEEAIEGKEIKRIKVEDAIESKEIKHAKVEDVLIHAIVADDKIEELKSLVIGLNDKIDKIENKLFEQKHSIYNDLLGVAPTAEKASEQKQLPFKRDVKFSTILTNKE